MTKPNDGGQELESAIRRVAVYVMEQDAFGNTILNLPPKRGHIYTVAELARKSGVSPRLLGKIRRRFKNALAQALTPGQDNDIRVDALMLFGRTAISFRKIEREKKA